MAGGIDWFRWHHGSVTDPKFPLIARRAGARLGDVVTVWAFALEQASAAVERGATGDLDCEALDCMLGAEDGTTSRILAAMGDRGLIADGAICNWSKRQPKKEDETANDRKRRQREREHEASIAASEASVTVEESRDVTQGHADVTPSHAREEKRREEKKEEKEQGSLVFAAADAAPAKSVRGSKKCPASFFVTPDLHDWANEKHPLIDIEAETAKFRDHTFGKAIVDWHGAWRNWIRNARPARASPGHANGWDDRKARQLETAALLTGSTAPKRQQPTQEVFDVTPRLITS